MLIPGLPFEAPLASEMIDMDERKVSDIHRFTVPFTMTGLPTLTMPGGFATGTELPVSIQLVARDFREQVLVRLGAAYQAETRWHDAHPDLG